MCYNFQKQIAITFTFH